MKIQRRKAPIFAIDRLRMGTDGKGITTLVCFMGCPLRCAYCLNDQCHDEDFELDGNTPRKGVIMLTPQELYNHVKIDNIYFQATEGGICFGGGEPMKQARFIKDFSEICGKKWKITIETSLYGASYNAIRMLSEVVDQWIVDVKDMNSSIYQLYTGKRHYLRQSLECLRMLNLIDNVHIKVPLIPDYNTPEDVERSVRELKEFGFNNIEQTCYIKRLSKYPPNTDRP